MTVYYSDNLSDATQPSSTLGEGLRTSAARTRGRKRSTVMRCTTTATDADEIRLGTFKSNDRILAIRGNNDGNPTAGAINLGLYLTGDNHDGAVVDEDLFGAAISVATADDNVEYMTEAVLVGTDRGKTLWELAAVGAATYTTDPMVNFDLVINPSTTFDAASIIVIEVEYLSGD